MRSIAPFLSLVILRPLATAAIDEYLPFSDPLFGQSNDELLVGRADACQSGYNSCSGLGDSGACCPYGSNCALDQSSNVACCPTSALCTGAISGTITGTYTSSSHGTLSTSGALTTTTTSSLSTVTSQYSTPAGLPTTGVVGGGSTIVNNFYPFVAIPTSYANPSLCLSAYTYCQSQSTACAASLGGSNGVTVSSAGGGIITVQGASGTTLDAASASSICSSLSQQACYGIDSATCGVQNAGATPASTSTFVQYPNSAPRPTSCPMVYAAGAGAMMGLGAIL